MPRPPPPLDPPPRILMGPGPSEIHPRVLAALGAGTVGHLDPYYLELMNGLQEMLRQVFRTTNPMTFAVSATGSAGMEAAVVNLIEPGDSMVVCVNGVFGQRMSDVANRAGAKVTTVERPWGEVFSPVDLKQALANARPGFNKEARERLALFIETGLPAASTSTPQAASPKPHAGPPSAAASLLAMLGAARAAA